MCQAQHHADQIRISGPVLRGGFGKSSFVDLLHRQVHRARGASPGSEPRLTVLVNIVGIISDNWLGMWYVNVPRDPKSTAVRYMHESITVVKGGGHAIKG